ncbi:hypothetical protein D3C73_1514780 [compost metagenome]
MGIAFLPVLPRVFGFPADQQQHLLIIFALLIEQYTDINESRHFFQSSRCAEFLNDLITVSFLYNNGSGLNEHRLYLQ